MFIQVLMGKKGFGIKILVKQKGYLAYVEFESEPNIFTGMGKMWNIGQPLCLVKQLLFENGYIH